MNLGLAQVQQSPAMPPEIAQDPAQTAMPQQMPEQMPPEQMPQQIHPMDRYAEEAPEEMDPGAETALGLAANPNVEPAVMKLQQAAQAFPQQGEQAFRNPEVVQALNLAFQPLIAQSVGSPLSENEIVGDAQLADIELTPRKTLALMLQVQPIDAQTREPSREPYLAPLTEGRQPLAQGGKPLELNQQQVMQAIQGLAQIAQFQKAHPEVVQQIQAQLEARPPDDARDLYNLMM
jgi:hypothetical protein